MSGVYLLFRFLLLIGSFKIGNITGWLLRALMFLSLSILILIVQPYKKSYMNVLDSLLLALLGFLTLLIVTFQYFSIVTDGHEIQAIMFVMLCGFPQLILVLSVIYRQLEGKRIVQSIAKQVSTLLKQACTRNHAEDQLSDANPLPHRLISPNQYKKSVNNYGSIS